MFLTAKRGGTADFFWAGVRSRPSRPLGPLTSARAASAGPRSSRRAAAWGLGVLIACVLFSGPLPARAQTKDRGLDVDLLLNYYDQDGDRSPVTGGIGTEALQVAGGVLDVNWALKPDWTLNGQVGVDSISSASTDNMDLGELEMSNASRSDARIYGHVGAQHTLGRHTVGATLGVSTEYDYFSLQTGLNWSVDLAQKNTTLAARFNQLFDTIELYGIDGVERGSDHRNTSDASFSVTQVLSKAMVGSVEVQYTRQNGFLSTPFQEVILASADGSEGLHVAERLPDLRERFAAGARLNVSVTRNIVLRSAYRYYNDTFGITAQSVEGELHFRLPTRHEMWLFPIGRYHTQTASDYFGEPGTFSGDEDYFTADDDLGPFDDFKVGLGYRWALPPGGTGIFGSTRDVELRTVYFDRQDGLSAVSVSAGIHWRF